MTFYVGVEVEFLKIRFILKVSKFQYNYYYNSNYFIYLHITNIIMSLITQNKAQKIITRNMRDLRLGRGLTQKGLSERSGVSLSSLRKFEQKGSISLESFLKLALTLGCMDKLIKATEPMESNFSSIDDVLAKDDKKPKRGKHG